VSKENVEIVRQGLAFTAHGFASVIRWRRRDPEVNETGAAIIAELAALEDLSRE